MSSSPYEFKKMRPHRRQGSPWRLVVLFCAVALLTAGGIWALLPKKAKSGPVQPLPAQTGSGTPEKPLPETKPPAPAPAPVPESKKPLAEEPDTPEKPLPETKVSEKTPDNAGPAIEAPAKGKPWAGDPPSEADRPFIPDAKTPEGFDARLAAAHGALAAGDLFAARDQARKCLAEPGVIFAGKAWREAAALLTRVNRQLWAAAPERDAMTAVHTVRSGESLLRIAEQYHATAAAVRIPNGLPEGSNLVKIGQRLRIVTGPWSVRIGKKTRLLELYRGTGEKRELFAVFDVGIGRLDSTPVGEFVIYDRCRANLSPEYGRSFLKLAAASTPDRPFAGIGIHGTDDEHSVTRAQSSGCIRMRNDDVDFLYAALPRRTPVAVTE